MPTVLTPRLGAVENFLEGSQVIDPFPITSFAGKALGRSLCDYGTGVALSIFAAVEKTTMFCVYILHRSK